MSNMMSVHSMKSSRDPAVHSMQNSRDPSGLDPSGIDVVAGADPPPDEYAESFESDPPILPPTIPSGPPPPTPRRTHPSAQQRGMQAPSPVMAFLVGEPPPPPPIPPPNKQLQRASLTRHHSAPTSPPGDVSTTTGISSVSSSIRPSRREPPREPAFMNANMVSYVDQKRREALDIYDSPDLYGSQPEDPGWIPRKFEPSEEKFEQPQKQPLEHRRSSSAVHTAPVDLNDNPFADDFVNSLASPRSAVTEPHSNKRKALRRNSQRTSTTSIQEPLDHHSSSGSQSSSDKSNNSKKAILGDGNTSKKRRSRGGRMSTGSTKVTKAPEKRGHRRGKSLERGRQTEAPEKEKKGFFRKIFRGGKKKPSEGPTIANGKSASNVKPSKAEEHKPVKARLAKALAVPTDGARVTVPAMPVLPPHKPAPSTVSANEAPQSGFQSGGMLSVDEQGFAAPLEMRAKPHKRPAQLITSPGDGAKEAGLGPNLDTVTSGLTNDTEPDRRDIFFAHDEVSTLTAPSMQSYSRRSVDPIESTVESGLSSSDPIEGTVTSGLSSEPVGHYWNTGTAGKAVNTESTPKGVSPTIDPFSEPFFREPDGESPITSSKEDKVKSKKLQVDVPHTQDPVGETPPTKHSKTHMNEPSPRGWGSPITELKDPLGSTISESASKRTVPGFGDPELAATPKLPPSQKDVPTAHEAQREPSAFRDGSPYALDPPLRVHEVVNEEETKELKKSLALDIITRVPPKAALGDRFAVELTTPTGSAAKEEVEPPVMSTVRVEPNQKENTENQAATTTNKGLKEKVAQSPAGEAPIRSPPIKATALADLSPALSPDKVKLKSSKAMEPDSLDPAGFLDDVFQEKPASPKRPSLIRPISINISEPTTGKASPAKENDSAMEPSSSETQVIQIHRTQRLSGSPLSNRAAPWNTNKVAAGEIPPLPIGASGSPKNHQDEEVETPPRALRVHQHLRGEEEEKKEQDHGKIYTVAEASSSKSMLATSTSALSTAVIQNAKTVAYLHTLNGEPSPRHAWRRPDLSDDEYSPVKSGVQRKAAANIKATLSKKGALAAVRSDEAAFDAFISSSPMAASPSTTGRSTLLNNGFARAGPANVARVGNTWSTKSLVVVSTRKPSCSQPSAQNNSKVLLRGNHGAHSPRSRKTARENFRRPLYYFRFSRDVRVTGAPLVFGLDLIRKKRIDDVLNGRIVPVYKDKATKTKKPPPSQFQCLVEVDIKDPIQRAGRRLLSKAAIPIQSAARRYLACREASTRASANIVLQSYFRRWKCEAFRIAYKFICIRIQAAFRSWSARGEIALQHHYATQIQKIVRGYIAATFVYDTLYWVSKLQAAIRGKLARNNFASLKERRQRCAVRLQAWYRGCLVRREASTRREAICAIQAIYRSYCARIKYQMKIVDIITTQSVARRFLARKEFEKRRLAKMNAAARKIQATWRGFQGYTDYIFALVDILVLQRSMRKWLAKNKVESMRRERAAIKIQAQWRRQTALIGMLYDLVHIIIAQSVVRRFLARKKIPQKRMEYSKKMEHQQMLDAAATKLQTAWRGFWGYSHFIIMQYEIIRLQAIIRGRASRILFSLKLGCCIMIQSAVRRHLANKKTSNMKLARAAQGAQVEGMRTKFACRRVQFWWRVVMECSKEKHAALVIERFFLMVKAEVDKEIIRQREIEAKEILHRKEKELQMKKQRARSSARPVQQASTHQRKNRTVIDADDENWLEKVWLNTVDEERVEVLACASQDAAAATKENGRSKSAPRPHMHHQNPSYVSQPSKEPTPHMVKHHPSSPTMNLVMRHENDPAVRRELELRGRKEEALKASRRAKQKSKPYPHDVTLQKCASELSAITTPTVCTAGALKTKGKGTSQRSQPRQPQQREQHTEKLEDDLSLEGLLGEDIFETTKSKRQDAPTSIRKGSKKHHFFSEDTTHELKGRSKDKHAPRRHSTSSIASEVSSNASEDVNDLRGKSTATTLTGTTSASASRSPTEYTGPGPLSEINTEVDMWKTVNQNLSSPYGMERKYGADKYLMSTTTSAALKGKKLIESVRGKNVSPRHGQIVVTNVPILSQDSRDNVEVEYGGPGGEQFGMI